jgi:hypothetical protein
MQMQMRIVVAPGTALLLSAMAARGWTQARLAEELTKAVGSPVGRNTVHRWGRGAVPSDFYQEALVGLLGIPRASWVVAPQTKAAA